MAWEFHVGQKVVCLVDEWEELRCGDFVIPTRVPMINEILTIAAMNAKGDAVLLSFIEIPLRQGTPEFNADIWYHSRHFRPLRERPTDISIFRAILNGTHVPEDA